MNSIRHKLPILALALSAALAQAQALAQALPLTMPQMPQTRLIAQAVLAQAATPQGGQAAPAAAAAPAPTPAPAAAPAAPPTSPAAAVAVSSGVGQVTHLSGTLIGRADGQAAARTLSARSAIAAGDTLSTQGDTYARVKFNDGTEVVLRPNTQFKIENFNYEEAEPSRDNILFGLIKGGLRSVSGLISKRSKDKIRYTTATATVGIRGTHFGMLMCFADCANIPTVSGIAPADGLHLDVVAGQIIVTNAAGSQVFDPGQFGFVQGANTPPAIVPPENGIRVTVPAVIASNTPGGRTIGNPAAGQSECRP